jgi:dTMP kinase
VSVDVGLARAGTRGPHDRLEAEVREFHDRVRAGYLEMAAAEPSRWVVVDGEGEAEDVSGRVAAAVEARGVLGGHAVP